MIKWHLRSPEGGEARPITDEFQRRLWSTENKINETTISNYNTLWFPIFFNKTNNRTFEKILSLFYKWNIGNVSIYKWRVGGQNTLFPCILSGRPRQYHSQEELTGIFLFKSSEIGNENEQSIWKVPFNESSLIVLLTFASNNCICLVELKRRHI